MAFARHFRKTLHFHYIEWIVAPNLSPWRMMSTCTALTEIEIRFPLRYSNDKNVQADSDQVNLEQIQCLRPIYTQLYVFRLFGTRLKLSTLLRLTKETEQMTSLTHRDVFIACNILPETD